MAKQTLDYPVKDLKNINKVLRNYFSEYVIDDRKIIGLSNLVVARRIAVLTDDPKPQFNKVYIQPNELQAELNNIKVTKAKCLTTDTEINFYNEGDVMVAPDFSLKRFAAFDENFLDIYKNDPIAEAAWSKLNTLNFESFDDAEIAEQFDTDRIYIFNVNGTSVITTKQLFPLYEKCHISAATVKIEKEESHLCFVVFSCQFPEVTVYTLVGCLDM